MRFEAVDQVFEIDRFLLQGSPEPFDEDVVHAPATPGLVLPPDLYRCLRTQTGSIEADICRERSEFTGWAERGCLLRVERMTAARNVPAIHHL